MFRKLFLLVALAYGVGVVHYYDQAIAALAAGHEATAAHTAGAAVAAALWPISAEMPDVSLDMLANADLWRAVNGPWAYLLVAALAWGSGRLCAKAYHWARGDHLPVSGAVLELISSLHSHAWTWDGDSARPVFEKGPVQMAIEGDWRNLKVRHNKVLINDSFNRRELAMIEKALYEVKAERERMYRANNLAKVHIVARQ